MSVTLLASRLLHEVDPSNPDSAIHHLNDHAQEHGTKDALKSVASSAPAIDWHALAPELTLAAVAILILVIDLFLKRKTSWKTSNVATIGLLASLIPVVTLAIDGTNRELFGGAYVVDNYALALKAFFIVGAYICVLIGADYIREGDYFQSEFWFLLTTSVLGMSALASSRDLITIFVAIETVTIPTFVMAGWRRRDTKSNEAAIKYYLIGVMSSAIMLFGMSYVVGLTGSTMLSEIQTYFTQDNIPAIAYIAVIFTLVGFAFKISAVPFHQWTPDVYEGAPTPVTAFLSVLSKAAGIVGLTILLQFGFFGADEVYKPILVLMVVASLIVGNFTALKQNNVVRMLAYSAIAQGGFIILPLALLGDGPGVPLESAIQATLIYLVVYLIANLGAFACVIAIARRTRSATLDSYNGLGKKEPFLAVSFSIFLFSLAGIPPLAGWFAKFVMFRAALDASNATGTVLAVIAVISSVVAFVYYAGVAKRMWLEEPGENTEAKSAAQESGGLLVTTGSGVSTTPALKIAIGLCAILSVVLGVLPGILGEIGELITSIS